MNIRLVYLSRQKIVDEVVNVVFEGEYLVKDEVTESEVEEGGSWNIYIVDFLKVQIILHISHHRHYSSRTGHAR